MQVEGLGGSNDLVKRAIVRKLIELGLNIRCYPMLTVWHEGALNQSDYQSLFEERYRVRSLGLLNERSRVLTDLNFPTQIEKSVTEEKLDALIFDPSNGLLPTSKVRSYPDEYYLGFEAKAQLLKLVSTDKIKLGLIFTNQAHSSVNVAKALRSGGKTIKSSLLDTDSLLISLGDFKIILLAKKAVLKLVTKALAGSLFPNFEAIIEIEPEEGSKVFAKLI